MKCIRYSIYQSDGSVGFKQLKKEILEYEKLKLKRFKIHNQIEEIKSEQEQPNAQFFQKNSKKKRKSQIYALQDNDGVLQKEPQAVIDIIYGFYQNL